MRARHYLVTVVTTLWVLLIASLIFAADIGHIGPISETTLIEKGVYCEDSTCAAGRPINLPFFRAREFKAGIEHLPLRFSFNVQYEQGEMQAIYLPSFDGDVSLRINGNIVRLVSKPSRLWNLPLLVSIPPNLLHDGKNTIALVLYGQPQEGLQLQPFYVGPKRLLSSAYAIRLATSITAAKLGLGLMAVLFVALGSIWIARPRERAYIWLALSCACAFVFLGHYGLDTSVVPYKTWTILWGFAVAVYVLFIMKFIKSLLGLNTNKLENIFTALLGVFFVAALIAPAKYVLDIVMSGNLLTLLLAITTLVVFWDNRRVVHRGDFFPLYVCLSISAALGLYELSLILLDAAPRNHHLFQYMPLVMSGACLWLIISRLVRTITGYEKLNHSLQQLVEQKTEQLKRSYRQLTEVEKARAVDDERKRIMLDLHDGIGGHLTNTLAYMENRNVDDEVLRAALEDALRELALVLDSFETEDSIATLLGMLRTRLEPLLEAHGLEFNWKIKAEPILPQPGPTQNLQIVRIVQEAITNIIKHAEATTITIEADETYVSIVDNGKGFQKPNSSQKHGGHGLAGMKRRAEQVGAIFKLASSSNGTTIKLLLGELNRSDFFPEDDLS